MLVLEGAVASLEELRALELRELQRIAGDRIDLVWLREFEEEAELARETGFASPEDLWNHLRRTGEWWKLLFALLPVSRLPPSYYEPRHRLSEDVFQIGTRMRPEESLRFPRRTLREQPDWLQRWFTEEETEARRRSVAKRLGPEGETERGLPLVLEEESSVTVSLATSAVEEEEEKAFYEGAPSISLYYPETYEEEGVKEPAVPISAPLYYPEKKEHAGEPFPAWPTAIPEVVVQEEEEEKEKREDKEEKEKRAAARPLEEKRKRKTRGRPPASEPLAHKTLETPVLSVSPLKVVAVAVRRQQDEAVQVPDTLESPLTPILPVIKATAPTRQMLLLPNSAKKERPVVRAAAPPSQKLLLPKPAKEDLPVVVATAPPSQKLLLPKPAKEELDATRQHLKASVVIVKPEPSVAPEKRPQIGLPPELLQEEEMARRKRFKETGWVEVKDYNGVWKPCVISLPKCIATGAENGLELPFLYASTATWHDRTTVSITVNDQQTPVDLRFKTREAAEEFKPYLDGLMLTVRLAAGNTKDLEIRKVSDGHMTVANRSSGRELELPHIDAEHRADSQDILNMLVATELQRLPSIELSDLELDLKRLMDFLRRVCPESLSVLQDREFTLARFRDQSPEGKVRVRLDLRKCVLLRGASTAKSPNVFPTQISMLSNFHRPTSTIELNAIVRMSPRSSASFLLCLYCDESFRLVAEDFSSVIERRAFGDLASYVCQFSHLTACAASLTGREKRVGDLIAAELARLPSDETVAIKRKEDDQWSTLGLTSTTGAWRGRLLQEFGELQRRSLAAEDLFVPLSAWRRIGATTVELEFDSRERLELRVGRPHLQRLFTAFCRVTNERYQNCADIGLAKTAKPRVERRRSLALLEYLAATKPEECAVLARAQVELRGRGVAPNFIRAHFNLLCIRVVPDSPVECAVPSVNLYGLRSITVGENFTVILTFLATQKQEEKDVLNVRAANVAAQSDTTSVELRFSKMIEMYALYSIGQEVLKFTRSMAPIEAASAKTPAKKAAPMPMAPQKEIQSEKKAIEKAKAADPLQERKGAKTKKEANSKKITKPKKEAQPAESKSLAGLKKGLDKLRQKKEPHLERVAEAKKPPEPKNVGQLIKTAERKTGELKKGAAVQKEAALKKVADLKKGAKEAEPQPERVAKAKNVVEVKKVAEPKNVAEVKKIAEPKNVAEMKKGAEPKREARPDKSDENTKTAKGGIGKRQTPRGSITQ